MAQQDNDGKERVIYYIDRTLVGYDLNYIPIECMHLIMVFASQNLHHFMLTNKKKFVARIDSLKCLLNKVILTRRLAKWVMMLRV